MARLFASFGLATVAAVLGLALAVVGSVDAGATDAVSPEGIGTGSCLPDIVFVGQVVDCVFPIDPPSAEQAQELSGVASAVLAAGPDRFLDDDLPRSYISSLPCRVEGSVLSCPQLRIESSHLAALGVDLDYVMDYAQSASGHERLRGGPRDPVTLSVAVDLGAAGVAWNRAGVTVLPSDRSAVSFLVSEDRTWVVAASVPRSVDVSRVYRQGRVWGLVRSWPERRTVQSLLLLEPEASDARVDVTIDEPGEYEIVACIGDDPGTCLPDPSGPRVVAIDPTPLELVAGHNLAGADRINLVVGGNGFTSEEAFLASARTLFDPTAQPVVAGEGAQQKVHFPVFSVEPFRSYAHRFNIWYLTDPIEAYTFFPWSALPESDIPDELETSVLGLDNVSILVLDAGPAGAPWLQRPGGGSLARAWTAPSPPEVSSDLSLGEASIFVDPTVPWTSSAVLVHELGHSLFGLTDEYASPEPGLRPEDVSADSNDCAIDATFSGHPNCANSLADAEAKWGDLVGELDPFFDEYQETLESYGLWGDGPLPELREGVTVGFHINGNVLKPTKYSFMSSDTLKRPFVPVFGSLNRRWAETLLNVFTGTAKLDNQLLESVLDLSCEPRTDGVACQGQLNPYVEAPADGLQIHAGGPPVTCHLDQARNEDPTQVTCPVVEPVGDMILASIIGTDWVEVAATPPSAAEDPDDPQPPTTATYVDSPDEQAAPPDPTNNKAPTVLLPAILLALAATTLAGMYVLRRRRR